MNETAMTATVLTFCWILNEDNCREDVMRTPVTHKGMAASKSCN